jgi:hypothetical protein
MTKSDQKGVSRTLEDSQPGRGQLSGWQQSGFDNKRRGRTPCRSPPNVKRRFESILGTFREHSSGCGVFLRDNPFPMSLITTRCLSGTISDSHNHEQGIGDNRW